MKLHSYKNLVFSAIIILVCFQINAQKSNCNYFNLPKPSLIPQTFNPKILDLKGSFKFNVEIKTCNEIYFTTIKGQENIYFSKKEKNKWSEPKITSFSSTKYSDADPFLTKNGNSIYFISKRPTHKNDKNLDWNIWVANRINDKWSEPKPLPNPINLDDSNEYFFSISDKGNVFFSSNRKGGNGSFDIYTAKIIGENKFSEAKNVGKPISTEKYEFDPYISPDESVIIFSINEKGNSSLYFSKKDHNNNWTEPKNLGDQINLTRQDFAPSLSAGGKFLFYSNNGKLKWVSSNILYK
ncbi:MAG: TolB family protein [Polaribacter sp.]